MLRAATLAAYPALANLLPILPADLRPSPPAGRGANWAAGQYVAGVESSGMVATLEALMDRGVIALPLHDAVLVPRSAAEVALEALREGYAGVVGVPPRFRVR
jgi:hypothetical protein